ncbi:hypothetical protein AQUCO_03500189v1 [Aquilegia coerulea]|uniref:KIB1-4 beta-propeller domain-containing protein n=1 Tax=Aquilegia coerulea TaxID=218851 RepID=A0A2G5CXL4_AQUCA|nr:hypothetical protein AQUCO_03500189v1 [Aquilegia coerulea]
MSSVQTVFTIALMSNYLDIAAVSFFYTFNKNPYLCAKKYHPIYSDTYMMNIPHELGGAYVRHAEYEWLLMSQGTKGGTSIFFFNPSTMETIRLPGGDLSCALENMSFSSPPTSSDYVVIGHLMSATDAVLIYVYRKCEDAWKLPSPSVFQPSHCSPVFHDGIFYSLAKDGKLGVFNPNETNEENMWRLLPNALAKEVSSPQWLSVIMRFFLRSYIMEYDGEILSVFLWSSGNSIVDV